MPNSMRGSGKAVIIDFGHALSLRDPVETQQHERGVVELCMKPYFAQALIERSKAPLPTSAGEQYSIDALLCFLLTGAHTHDFVLE